MMKNLMMKNRQYYKIEKDGRIFEGILWIRKFFKHDGGFSAFVFIGSQCLGRLYINKLGILFNLKKIDSYNKIKYKKGTIVRHFRRSIIKYFDSFIIRDIKIKAVEKISYLDSLKRQVSLLLCD